MVEVLEGLFIDGGRVGQAPDSQMAFVCRQQGRQLSLLFGAGEGSPREVHRAHAGQAELADSRPQGIRHLRMLGQGAEVSRGGGRQLQQEPHEECGTKGVRRGVDLLFDQEGGGHLQGEIQRRDESQVHPARALQRQPLGQCVAGGMRRHKDPFCGRSMGPAQVGELGEKGLYCHAGPSTGSSVMSGQ